MVATQRTKRLRSLLLVGALALIVLSVALAVFQPRPWIVPLAEKARRNPLPASDANLAAAKETYKNKCDSCHGEKGKGDGTDAMMYDPPPADLTDSSKIDERTDGEIFYQISEGRKPMPSFKKKLSEEQRWQLVLLVREFAASSATKARSPGSD
jgi:mono/diheme cytochrome c family protein